MGGAANGLACVFSSLPLGALDFGGGGGGGREGFESISANMLNRRFRLSSSNLLLSGESGNDGLGLVVFFGGFTPSCFNSTPFSPSCPLSSVAPGPSFCCELPASSITLDLAALLLDAHRFVESPSDNLRRVPGTNPPALHSLAVHLEVHLVDEIDLRWRTAAVNQRG